MNYLLIPIIVLAIFANACTPTVQPEETETTTKSVDVEEGFTLSFKGNRSEGDQSDIYKGEAVVSGELVYQPLGQFFTITFILDEESVEKVPQSALSYERFVPFNSDFLFEKSGLNDYMNENKSCEGFNFDATLRIKDYELTLVEGEARDKSNILEVLEVSEITGSNCE